MKNVGNSSNGRSQGVPKISGHPCIGGMGTLRGHLCDSTAFLFHFLLGQILALLIGTSVTVNTQDLNYCSACDIIHVLFNYYSSDV